MKRYLLFSGCDYYPSGGVEDFVRSFESPKAIEQHLRFLDEKDEKPEWSNVLDIVTGTRYSVDRYSYRLKKIE